jgi:hypothetical protein
MHDLATWLLLVNPLIVMAIVASHGSVRLSLVPARVSSRQAQGPARVDALRMAMQ